MNKIKRKQKMKDPLSLRIFLIAFFVVFVIYSITLLYPLFWAFINSVKTVPEYFENNFNFSKEWVFKNFYTALIGLKIKGATLPVMFFNTFWMTVMACVATVTCSILTAYTLARYRFPFKTFIFSLAIFVQIVPVMGSGASLYKFLYAAGIADNPALIWLMWAGGFDFAFIVMYGFFKSISWSYAESAFMDGASNFTTMVRVMLPQAMGIIIALLILNSITFWNDYNTSLLYMKSYPTMALGIYLFDMDSSFATAGGKPVFLAAVLISLVPIIILFACTQKIVMNNVSTGGLKG